MTRPNAPDLPRGYGLNRTYPLGNGQRYENQRITFLFVLVGAQSLPSTEAEIHQIFAPARGPLIGEEQLVLQLFRTFENAHEPILPTRLSAPLGDQTKLALYTSGEGTLSPPAIRSMSHRQFSGLRKPHAMRPLSSIMQLMASVPRLRSPRS